MKKCLCQKNVQLFGNFFQQVDNEGKKRVVCELCKASLAYCGGTTTMKTHLTHKHPSILLCKLKNSQFIYLGFYVVFNTVQVISRWVVGRAEETSTYSS